MRGTTGISWHYEHFSPHPPQLQLIPIQSKCSVTPTRWLYQHNYFLPFWEIVNISYYTYTVSRGTANCLNFSNGMDKDVLRCGCGHHTVGFLETTELHWLWAFLLTLVLGWVQISQSGFCWSKDCSIKSSWRRLELENIDNSERMVWMKKLALLIQMSGWVDEGAGVVGVLNLKL